MKLTLSEEQKERLQELGMFTSVANGSVYLIDIIQILPKKITDRMHIYELRMGVTDCIGADEQWYVVYKDSCTDVDELDSFQSAEELCVAIYSMLCWLKSEDNKNLVWL